MKLSFNILLFGWWLASQCWTSRGQTLPKPSISANFSGTVALGEGVAIFCRAEDAFHGKFYLTRITSPSYKAETVETKEAEPNWTAFFLSPLTRSYGGNYNCRSCYVMECSDFSDVISLNLTDPSLNKPTIQILNVKKHPYFTIRCEAIEQDLTFALLKSKKQIKYKAAESGEKAVDFFLYWKRLEEVGSYTCQYHQESNPFLWSVPSDPLDLPLRDPEIMNPTMEMIPGEPNASDILSPYLWAGIGVSAFLVVVLLLAVVLYRKRRKNSKTSKDNPAMNLSSAAEEHPDEVSYAILNHQPRNTQQATNPWQTPEPCLYASVS